MRNFTTIVALAALVVAIAALYYAWNPTPPDLSGYATVDQIEGLAAADHAHEGFAAADHTHEAAAPAADTPAEDEPAPAAEDEPAPADGEPAPAQ